MRIQKLAFLCSVVVSLFATGCKERSTTFFGQTVPQHPPNVLWANNASEPEWLDPGKVSDSAGSELIWNMFSGLAQYHPTTLQPIPDIAKCWIVSDDGTQYTFHLRDSVWSDGTPNTAHDFEWSWKRVLDPATDSKYASMMFVLKNGEPVNQRAIWVHPLPAGDASGLVRNALEGVAEVDRVTMTDWPEHGAFVYLGGPPAERAANRNKVVAALNGKTLGTGTVQAAIADTSLIGTKATDDHTLEVRLEGPVPYFRNLLPFYTFLPVPRHVIEKLEKDGLNPDLWTRPEHIVVNGPYQMTEHRFRQHYWFGKNPRYWDAEHVKLDKVKQLLVESYTTNVFLYHAAEVDWTGNNSSLPSEYMDTLKDHYSGADFRREPYLSVYFYWINTKQPPMDNLKLRQALSLAIDRQRLVDKVTRAGQLPTADLVPDGLAGYEGLHRPIFDPEKARQLFKESGYDPAKDPPITVIYNTSEGHKLIAEAVQQMWKDTLGVEVVIENQEWKVFLKNQILMNFQISRMGWVGDYADPYTFLELLTEASGNNHSNWTNRKYDDLLREANTLTDPEQRMRLFHDAEELMMEDQPIIPFYVYTRSQLVKPYLRGFWGNYQDRHPWKYMWIDERWYDGPLAKREEDPLPELPAQECEGY